MEQKIETAIDAGLERMAGGFYLFDVVLGIALIIAGVVLLTRKKFAAKRALGWFALALGGAAIASGLLQMRGTAF